MTVHIFIVRINLASRPATKPSQLITSAVSPTIPTVSPPLCHRALELRSRSRLIVITLATRRLFCSPTSYRANMPPKNKYTDPKLRDEAKEAVQRGDKGGAPGQWSARKASSLSLSCFGNLSSHLFHLRRNSWRPNTRSVAAARIPIKRTWTIPRNIIQMDRERMTDEGRKRKCQAG